MPIFRFLGEKPMRYGAHLIAKGEAIRLSVSPNRLFQPIEAEILAPEPYPSGLVSLGNDLALRINAHAQTMHALGCDISFTPYDLTLLYKIVQQVNRPGAVALDFASGWGFTLQVLMIGGSDMILYGCEQNVKQYAWLEELAGDQATIWKGDIQAFAAQWPSAIDLLVLDAEHSKKCAQWYVEHLWPLVRPGGYIWLHDMMDREDLGGEYAMVQEALTYSPFDVLMHTKDCPISTEAWDDLPHRNQASPNCVLVLQRRRKNAD